MASAQKTNYYDILGVSQSATSSEIRKAFQQKARKLHPDINKAPDAEERFKEVSEAYAVLSDEQKRRRYDASLNGNPFMSQSPYGSQDPFAQGGFSTPDGFDLDDFLRAAGFGSNIGFDFFTQNPSSTSSSESLHEFAYQDIEGKDITVLLHLDDKQAKQGCTKKISYTHFVACDACHGLGAQEELQTLNCPICDGKGTLELDFVMLLGMSSHTMVCSHCKGSGKLIVNPCANCAGSGRSLKKDAVEVLVPTHTHDGHRIVLKHKGHAGTYNKPAHDLIIECVVASERLIAAERLGARCLGFVIPILAIGLYTNTLYYNFVFPAILVIIGITTLCKRGIVHPLGWWRSAGKAGYTPLLISFCLTVVPVVIRKLLGL